MHLYFDESGDYAFPPDRFDCYAQAAVICPDSFRSQAETFVASRCESWGVAELHAAQMSGEQLLEIAEFIAGSPIELGVQVTDTVHTTKAVIREFRLSQADAYARSLERYRKGGGADTAYITDTGTRIKQAGLSSQIPDGEFVQATLLVDGVLQAVQRCLYAYPGDRWRDDFEQFRVIVDGKLPGKRSAGEKYLAEMIILILGGLDRYTLNWHPEWHCEPLHPFVRRFVVDGRVELDALLSTASSLRSRSSTLGFSLLIWLQTSCDGPCSHLRRRSWAFTRLSPGAWPIATATASWSQDSLG